MAATDDAALRGGPLLAVVGKQAEGEGNAVIMEPGTMEVRVDAPDARAAWLYYRPDTGEPRQYPLRLVGGAATAGFPVDVGTAGLVYVVARGDGAGPVYSNAVGVESAPHRALAEAASPNPHLRIEVNLPAFELRVYRANELLRKFRVGIGMRDWPVPPGLRLVREVVWNPQWAPPDSPWATPALVHRLQARGEVLGRLKIPLGGEILIHGTGKPRDLGRLVSHGCIRMLNRDIRQLGRLLIAESGAQASPELIRRAEKQHKFVYGVKLPAPLEVYIRYEPTLLLAGKTVQLPDVYGWKPAAATGHNTKNTHKSRAGIQESGAGIPANVRKSGARTQKQKVTSGEARKPAPSVPAPDSS